MVGAVCVAAAALTVIGVPVVGARRRIGILDLIDVNRRVRARNQNMVGGRGIAILVGVVQFVGIADHHVVGVGSAHRRLMVIVVQGVFAGELGQIGRVALGDVVEAHRDIAFLERVRRRIAVAAGGDGLLAPGEQVGLTAACIVPGHLAGVAVKLLPQLVEAMPRP